MIIDFTFSKVGLLPHNSEINIIVYFVFRAVASIAATPNIAAVPGVVNQVMSI